MGLSKYSVTMEFESSQFGKIVEAEDPIEALRYIVDIFPQNKSRSAGKDGTIKWINVSVEKVDETRWED
jgi:hypothetical protein